MTDLFLRKLFYFFAVFNPVNENLCRLEARNVVLIYYYSSIAGNIPCNFFLSLFIYETTKATDVNIFTGGHGRLYDIEKRFYGMRHICFVYSGLFSDLCYNVCFGHIGKV